MLEIKQEWALGRNERWSRVKIKAEALWKIVDHNILIADDAFIVFVCCSEQWSVILIPLSLFKFMQLFFVSIR